MFCVPWEYSFVNSVEDCPEIAIGEGSVITGRFLTRQVDEIARVEIRGIDGTIETLQGTSVHPIWSLDHNDWVPLGELDEGECLQGQDGSAIVMFLCIVHRSIPVYNIEVQGQHVYEVGILGLVVHNIETCLTYARKVLSRRPEGVIISMQGRNGAIGILPGYSEGAVSHYFHLQNGILRDDVFRRGIDIGAWLKKYANANQMPVSQIFDEVFFQVFKW